MLKNRYIKNKFSFILIYSLIYGQQNSIFQFTKKTLLLLEQQVLKILLDLICLQIGFLYPKDLILLYNTPR